MRVLLVEDSYNLADTLSSALQREHYIVDVAYDGQQGYEYAASGIYDAAILDLMLPKLNGYEVLARLRRDKSPLPVLILSAKSELDDKLKGFEYGADDYLTKPFETKELVARLQAISRRKGEIQEEILSCGNLQLNRSTCVLSNPESGKQVVVGGKEFQLMEYLLTNQNLVVSKEQIAEKIWGYNNGSEYNNVEVYVSFLRKKMSFINSDTRIRAVRGLGYTLEANQKEL